MSNVGYHNRCGARGAANIAFRDVFGGAFAGKDANESAAPSRESAGWTPRVDIREEAARFVILADLPGVDPDAVELEMEQGTLTISGERTADDSDEGITHSRRERSCGAFRRRFALPDSADAGAISAMARHGVLEVVIPKKPETKPRRIQVGSGTVQ